MLTSGVQVFCAVIGWHVSDVCVCVCVCARVPVPVPVRVRVCVCLSQKLKAIEELKEQQASGKVLQKNQVT